MLHYEKFCFLMPQLQLRYYKFPEEFHVLAIHTEVVAYNKSATFTAGLLNSRPNTSIMSQSNICPLVLYIWDMEGPGIYDKRSIKIHRLVQRSPCIDFRQTGKIVDQFYIKRLFNPKLIRISLQILTVIHFIIFNYIWRSICF